MKLLFDQNISFRIVKKVQDSFPGSKQVSQVGLNQTSDFKIWEYAKENGFSIVTFDSDFYDLCLLKGIPPKIIWLRCGNTSTNNILQILMNEEDHILSFLGETEDQTKHCLEIG
jgi:predicted nuclease of predicted toxin-antitoxin system